jgi:hypothetical protein
MSTSLGSNVAGAVFRRKTLSSCPHSTWAYGAIFAVITSLVGNQILNPMAACSGAGLSAQIVNRAEKGNRLLLRSRFHLNGLNHSSETKGEEGTPPVDNEFLDGCESLASPLAPVRQMPGRCLS